MIVKKLFVSCNVTPYVRSHLRWKILCRKEKIERSILYGKEKIEKSLRQIDEVCYDWSKGAEKHNPSTAKESDLKGKPRAGKSRHGKDKRFVLVD